jgi:hypothetical protein
MDEELIPDQCLRATSVRTEVRSTAARYLPFLEELSVRANTGTKTIFPRVWTMLGRVLVQ